MSTSSARVLIVDDETALRHALRTSLEASGFTVDEAASGEEALKVFNRAPLDLVLLDINIPGIGGVETCQKASRDGAIRWDCYVDGSRDGVMTR